MNNTNKENFIARVNSVVQKVNEGQTTNQALDSVITQSLREAGFTCAPEDLAHLVRYYFVLGGDLRLLTYFVGSIGFAESEIILVSISALLKQLDFIEEFEREMNSESQAWEQTYQQYSRSMDLKKIRELLIKYRSYQSSAQLSERVNALIKCVQVSSGRGAGLALSLPSSESEKLRELIKDLSQDFSLFYRCDQPYRIQFVLGYFNPANSIPMYFELERLRRLEAMLGAPLLSPDCEGLALQDIPCNSPFFDLITRVSGLANQISFDQVQLSDLLEEEVSFDRDRFRASFKRRLESHRSVNTYSAMAEWGAFWNELDAWVGLFLRLPIPWIAQWARLVQPILAQMRDIFESVVLDVGKDLLADKTIAAREKLFLLGMLGYSFSSRFSVKAQEAWLAESVVVESTHRDFLLQRQASAEAALRSSADSLAGDQGQTSRVIGDTDVPPVSESPRRDSTDSDISLRPDASQNESNTFARLLASPAPVRVTVAPGKGGLSLSLKSDSGAGQKPVESQPSVQARGADKSQELAQASGSQSPSYAGLAWVLPTARAQGGDRQQGESALVLLAGAGPSVLQGRQEADDQSVVVSSSRSPNPSLPRSQSVFSSSLRDDLGQPQVQVQSGSSSAAGSSVASGVFTNVMLPQETEEWVSFCQWKLEDYLKGVHNLMRRKSVEKVLDRLRRCAQNIQVSNVSGLRDLILDEQEITRGNHQERTPLLLRVFAPDRRCELDKLYEQLIQALPVQFKPTKDLASADVNQAATAATSSGIQRAVPPPRRVPPRVPPSASLLERF